MRKMLGLFSCLCISLLIYAQPAIVPTGPTGFCAGGNIVLTITGADAGSAFLWTKDGIPLVGETTLKYTASSPGLYSVILTTAGNIIPVNEVSVSAYTSPIADFTFDNSNTCSGASIPFTSTVSNGTAPFAYSWNFGDGKTSLLQNPSHSYDSIGCGTALFNATLNITDANGCTSVVTKQINVNLAPDLLLKDVDSLFSPFANCDQNPTVANPNFTLTVINSSPGSACTNSYSIDWGDNSAIINNPTFPLTHIYTQLGSFNLIFSAISITGCRNSKTYVVANQSNPAGGLGTLGSTIGLCAPTTVPFIIGNWQNNSPGTKYILSYGDGVSITLNHPLINDTVIHTYIKSSCPDSIAFTVRLLVTNACASTPFTAGSIQVRVKSVAQFIAPDTVCVNQNAAYVYTSTTGYSGSSCGTATEWYWNFGDGSPILYNVKNPLHKFTAPGAYTVTLTSINPCDTTYFKKSICVAAPAISSFTLDNIEGCAPMTVLVTNNSSSGAACLQAAYRWKVVYTPGFCGVVSSWKFNIGSDSSSANPSFLFSNPGSYSISLDVINPCGTVTSKKTVIIKQPSVITIPFIPNVCSSVTFNPTATVKICGNGAVSYLWTFTGGSPSTSTNIIPGAVSFTTPGINSVTLAVTNDCGTVTSARSFIINPAPNLVVPGNTFYCNGKTTAPLISTSTNPRTIFSWTNNNPSIGLAASGSGASIASFIPKNNTQIPAIATISVKALGDSGCTTILSFTITVNPSPSKPTIVNAVSFCLNENALPLIANPSSGNTITWYTSDLLVNGSSTSPVPVTTIAGTTTYYVTQSNSYNCESDTARITVTVNPKISNNIISADQAICSGNSAQTLVSAVTSGGSGIYSYQWQSSADGGLTWTNITNALSATFNPGVITATTQYRRVANSASCSDTSNKVILSVQGILVNIGITGSQTICTGSIPGTLLGQPSSSGNNTVSYEWEQSFDNIIWTTISGATSQDYAPPALSLTTYFRRKAVGGQCTAYSPPVKITVNAKPDIILMEDKYYCNNSPSGIITFNGTPSGSSYLWINDNNQIGLAASGTGDIVSFTTINSSNPKLPVTAHIKVVHSNTNNTLGCSGDTMAFKIVVLPAISIAPLPDEINCAGILISALTPIPDTGSFAGISIQYSWTVSGNGLSLVNGTGTEIPSYFTVNNGPTDVTATITVTPVYSFNGKSCIGIPTSYKITVKAPATAAYAGADIILCDEATTTLVATNINGTTGIWSQAGTDATITFPASNITQINNLRPGIYKFTWTQSGFGACPGTTDTVIVDNKLALTNKIDTITKFICAGININVLGQAPSGGSGSYNYQWQQSTDGINFINIQGAILQSLSFTPSTSTWLRRFVNASPCSSYSDTAQIQIQSAITNNNINSDETICSGTQSQTIIGSQPAGGDNQFNYIWEQSLNGGNSWTTIPGAGVLNYSPGILFQTTSFRRRVETNLCNNSSGSVSNTVVVTVNSAITNNVVSSNQAICNGSTTQPLMALTIGGGTGVYLFQWQSSADSGTTWLNIAGAVSAIFSPGAITATTQYRRAVASGSCSDTSNIITISVQSGLTNTGITGSQTICTGSQPATLPGQLPGSVNTVITYQWESSEDSTNWTAISGANTQNYTPLPLTITTYFRRKVISGQCTVTSQPVQITVNSKPVIIPVKDIYICNNSPLTIVFNTSPASSTYVWTNTNTQTGLAATGNGSISFTTTNNSNPKIPISSNVKVAATFTNNSIGCLGDTITFNITVLPFIALATIQDEIKCTGVIIPALTPIPDTGSFAGISVLYNWLVSGSGITLTSGSGTLIPSYITVNNGSTDAISTITITPRYTYNGKTCDGIPASYTVTVKPATASANAGADMLLCNAGITTLSASFVNGTSGIWTGVGNNAIIASPSSNITQITNLQPGQVYQFVWTQTGFANCAATTDTVVVNNKPELINKIDTATATICTGVTTTVSAQLATGGGGNYLYQWQQSKDGITFTDINGATSQNISITPVTSIWMRRYVDASPCFSYSDTVRIIVQPALTNNNISADATICMGVTAAPIIGSDPAGGNGQFSYLWEQSPDGGNTWTIIPGAANINYSPGALFQTTSFRRRMSTSLCTGNFGSVSNIVTITVNPDAKASFTSTSIIKCAPFAITPSIITVQPSPSNSLYQWYANGTLLGTGITFPGYTIVNENDSVTIQLITRSLYGCKNDSHSQEFYSQKTVRPSFTLIDTVVCGPISVLATNTSLNLNQFNYFWDFGNGQTSAQLQPAAILFATNPNYGDTTYTIKLTVFSPCDTLSFSQSIRVKSKPKALFTPTRTTGCSPMTVTFKNTSQGTNINYYWDFGDGSTLSAISSDSVSHTYLTGIVDTFYVSLKASNECGADSITYSIIVSPNNIRLNLAVNGTDQYGCTPHAVAFFNNSQGASTFRWNFGDGNSTATTKNVDTVYHTYLTSGNFIVSLQALNNCSDTTTTQKITVYPKPKAAFSGDKYEVCIGNEVTFTNLTDSATAYLWDFGDCIYSSNTNPIHTYYKEGNYTIKLLAFRNNPSGDICDDSTSQKILVVALQAGSFTVSDSTSQCAPLAVTFVNQNRPSISALWDFGDGNSANGDSVNHSFLTAGTFKVTLTVTVTGGCTYVTTKIINVLGPAGTLLYQNGFICSKSAVRLQAIATGASTYLWNFGDGTTQSTTDQIVFHTYVNPGNYIPSVTLQNTAGCNIPIAGSDTIKVDKAETGFEYSQQKYCGYSVFNFTDTSNIFFGKALVKWDFGDGSSATGPRPAHTYTASGIYTIQLIVISNSGCTDTVVKQVDIIINSVVVISISAETKGCTATPVLFTGSFQSVDSINIIHWTVSDGATGKGKLFSHIFTSPGTYSVNLIAGTENGCYDTAYHTIQIDPSPVLTVSPSLNICRGASTQLQAIGAATYQWLPLQGLSCYTCPAPIASPNSTTPYVVEGRNSFGCSIFDTIVVTVIPPVHLNVSPGDSICIGQSTNLLASGATSYNWSPALGLNSTTLSNPTASPTVTTIYRVIGYDGFNCFTDTAFVTVGVGQYPTIYLGPDLTLAAGTLHPLTSVITNGPISKWLWTPNTNLSCNGCAIPVAEIKKNITYSVEATTPYGCPATDTINIKVFCEESQVFIPNAFTPDNDGLNDVLMVRGKGIVLVKFFRIFNRWGDLVFEKSNFEPNNPLYGWDGTIKGHQSGPEVFIYSCEVICENGSVFTFKGNVSLIK